MRKNTLFSISVYFVLSLFFSACQSSNNQPTLWKQIKQTDSFDFIAISERYGLFLGDSTNSHKIYHYPDKKIQSSDQYITIDYKEQFRKTCFMQDDFWFVTKNSLKIIKYSPLAQTLTEYPEINKLGNVVDCSVTDNNNLVVWGDRWVAQYYFPEWKSYSLNITIKHAIEDADNKLWALSDKSEIFYLDGEKWILWNTLQSKDPARRIWKIGGTIFISTTKDGVYRWKIGSKNPEQIIKFEPDTHDFTYVSIINIEKDNDGNILVMGINKLWMMKQNIVSEIKLPNQGISYFAYDRAQNGIYATNPTPYKGGLYYLNLLDVDK